MIATISNVLDLYPIIDSAQRVTRVVWRSGPDRIEGVVQRIATSSGRTFSDVQDLEHAHLEIQTLAGERVLYPLPAALAMLRTQEMILVR